MKSVSGKRLAKLASNKGWNLARINGSHHIFTMEGRIERLVIPIHGNQTLKAGLQRDKQSSARASVTSWGWPLAS